MNRFFYTILSLLLLTCNTIFAQLEKVLVETYYISDAADATDTIGGLLDSGSVTYRIYVDMKKGSKLTKIYGDANHQINISSNTPFFNNTDRGVSFAKDLQANRLSENTVALDTWLTLGQATKNGSLTYFGVLKSNDTAGSIIGGSNNDGGSAAIPGGLLVNADAVAGIPLTIADGLDTLSNLPSNWFDVGIKDIVSGVDSTIFGSVKTGFAFISNDMSLQNSGVTGIDTIENHVLIAQLTTKGVLTFEINLSIEDSTGTTINYVANDSILASNEKISRYLKYPFQFICGCPDPNYIEYNPDRDCESLDSCKNIIVFGCMDVNACNFNPDANYAISFLCCYPGYCNDRDITVVCPEISNVFDFIIYPNPPSDHLNIEIPNGNKEHLKYVVFDAYGKQVFEKILGDQSDYFVDRIDVSSFHNGLYLLLVTKGSETKSKIFIKN